MSKTYSLDTNGLLALVLPSREVVRQKLTNLLATHEFNVNELAVNEAEYVLSKVYELPRNIVAANIYAICSTDNIRTNRTLWNKVLPVYVEHPALSFVDICLMFNAQIEQASPLYTSDKKLVNQSAGLAKLI